MNPQPADELHGDLGGPGKQQVEGGQLLAAFLRLGLFFLQAFGPSEVLGGVCQLVLFDQLLFVEDASGYG